MTQVLSQSLDRNRQYRCNAQGCHNLRYNLASHCRTHFKNQYLYGDPLGRSIPRKEYLKEYEEVSSLINRNLGHTATDTALKFIQTWLDIALTGKACVAGGEISRLAFGGVSASEILIESTALYLYSQRHPKKLPDDDRLSYQLGNVVFRLRPQAAYISMSGKKAYRRAAGTTRKIVGKRLREALGLFFVNVYSTLRRKLEIEQEQRERLWIPLEA